MITETNLQNSVKCLKNNIPLNFKRLIGQGQLDSTNKLKTYFQTEVIRDLEPIDVLLYSSLTNPDLDQEMLALYQRARLENEMVLVPKNNKIYILNPR